MSLLVKVGLDSKDLQDGLDKAESKTKSSTANIVKGLSNIGGAAVLGGIAAAGVGAVALGGFLTKSVQAASEAEDIQTQLAAVLAQTGKVTGVTTEQINEMAQSLSMVTKFDDEVITSAGAVLARFDKIGAETMPAAMQATLDLAESMGIDLSSAAVMVGKVLQTPGEGMMRLKAAGVALTDEQTDLIQSLFDSGKTAEAQDMILKALSGTMGGVAQAAGSTLNGKLAILKTQFGNVMETVGGALLPKLTELATMLSDKLADPAVQAWISNFAAGVADFAGKVINYIPIVIGWFQQVSDWLSNNQGVIIGVLAALGVAIAAFVYTTVIPAAIAVIAASWPIIAVMAVIAAAVWLLYTAWTDNWGGIQEKLAAVWEVIQPIFQTVKTWLETNIPIAIQILTDYWNNVLMPAIMTVWAWIQANLIPLFEAVGELIGVTLVLALTAAQGFWENVLWPSFQKVVAWINENLIPVIKTVVEWVRDHLAPAFSGVSDAISGVIDWIKKVSDALSNIKLPAWLTPGSPTPFELGLRGIGDAMADLSKAKLPALQMELTAVGMAGSRYGQSMTNNYSLNINTNAPDSTLQRDFAMMRARIR
jgi:hypothetical protein